LAAYDYFCSPEFKYAIKSDISAALKRGHGMPFPVIISSIAGPCCHSTEIMAIAEYASLPLASFGAPVDESLWQAAQFFSVKTLLPRAVLPSPRKYWRAQI